MKIDEMAAGAKGSYIGIDESALSRLRLDCDAVGERLEDIRSAEKEIGAAQEKLALLDDQIENADRSGIDDKSFAAFDLKRRQRDALRATIEELDRRMEVRRGALSRLLARLGESFGAVVRPGYDIIIARAAEAFSPFYRDRSWGEQAAKHSDIAMAYLGFIRTDWGQIASSACINEAEYALRLSAEVLGGKNSFRFGSFTF